MRLFIFFAAVIMLVFAVLQDYAALPEWSVRQFNRDSSYESGPLRIRGKMPYGPGGHTFAPHLTVPYGQRFYVSVAEWDTWCINEDCGVDGALINTLGGWLQVENTYQPTVKEMFGLNVSENKDVISVVVVGDRKGRIRGIYPNKGLKDVMSILVLHPRLVDFSILSGVSEFGSLRIGEEAPLLPGYAIGPLSDELVKFSVTQVPEGKRFYMYALQKRKYDIVGMNEPHENVYDCFLGSCRYSEPDPAHDFLFDTIDKLGGWFLANSHDNVGMIKLFGLEPREVLSGKSSLVVVTDSEGIIVALHPGKTLSDAITILSQLPELVDMSKIYGKTEAKKT